MISHADPKVHTCKLTKSAWIRKGSGANGDKATVNFEYCLKGNDCPPAGLTFEVHVHPGVSGSDGLHYKTGSTLWQALSSLLG